MGIVSRPTMIALAVATSMSLGLVRDSNAGLTLSLKYNGATLSVPTLQGNAGQPELYSFGGSNKYAVYELKGGDVKSFLGLFTAAEIGGFSSGSKLMSIQVVITNNAPGTDEGARLFNVTHDVRTTGGGGGSAALEITAMESNFMAPTGAVLLDGTFSFSAISGDGSGSFLSEVLDSGGHVLDSVSGTGTKAIADLAGPYRLRNTTTITMVGPGTNYSTNGRTQILPDGSVSSGGLAAVPEPSTILMGSMALGLLVLGRGLRRLRRSLADS
jgi:hypothetical protein